MKIDIITNPETLFSLKEEWDALYEKSDKPYFTDSYIWNLCCWRMISEPRKDFLYCLIIRCQDEIVLIWPLVIRKKDYFWRIAHPLSFISTEYSNVLVDTAQDQVKLVVLAVQSLIKDCACDLIQLTFTKADSLLFRVLGKSECNNKAPYIDWHRYPDWNAYYTQLDTKLRHNLSRRAKRLSELGDVSFKMLTGKDKEDNYRQEIKWLIEAKEEWAKAKYLKTPFPENYFEFFNLLFNYTEKEGRMQLCVLKLNNKTIGANLMRIDRVRIEFIVAAFDPEFSKFSPLQLIAEYCVKWAFEQRLNVDYRLGDGDHKRDWVEQSCDIFSYQICRTVLGRTYAPVRESVNKVKQYWRKARRAYHFC